MPIITADQLRRLCPHARPDIVAAIATQADDVLPRYGITTPLRLQHFMAHVAVESAFLTRLEENLNYSAERLVAVWPRRFPTIAAAAPYAHNPQRLAAKVYGGRLGNRGADDGWLFRGQGLLQTTGRDNALAVEAETGLGVVSRPDILTSREHMLECAAATWKRNRCNRFADADDLVGSTRAVNGGLNGLDERKACRERARTIFAPVAASADEAPPAPRADGGALFAARTRPRAPSAPSPAAGIRAAIPKQQETTMLKGWKTLIFNGAVAGLGLAQGLDWVGVLGSERAGLVLAGIGFANMALRSLTTTPVGMAKPGA